MLHVPFHIPVNQYAFGRNPNFLCISENEQVKMSVFDVVISVWINMTFMDKWLILSFSKLLFQSFSETVSQSKLQPSWYWRPFQTILFQPPHPHWRTFTLWCLTVRALGFICRKWPRWMLSDDCAVALSVACIAWMLVCFIWWVLCRPFFFSGETELTDVSIQANGRISACFPADVLFD